MAGRKLGGKEHMMHDAEFGGREATTINRVVTNTDTNTKHSFVLGVLVLPPRLQNQHVHRPHSSYWLIEQETTGAISDPNFQGGGRKFHV